MQLLYLFEKIRNPFFDFFFSAITYLGDETAFLLIAILVFWCVNKRSGYFVLITGFFGTIINQIMKLAFRVPRPWVIDPDFTIVESAREAATGYSFPSGHTQNAVGTFGSLFLSASKKWIKIICIIAAILVPVSRMYLGVHTPWDVMASVGCAIILIIVLQPIFASEKTFSKAMPYIVVLVTLFSLAFFIYAVIATPKSEDVNALSAAKNACTLLGCSAGLILVYIIDNRFVKFDTKARWYAQVMKFVIGVAIVFAIKTFLKIPLLPLLGEQYERIIRYFVIVAFAGAVWPLTFNYFAKLRIPALDKFGEKVKAMFVKNDTVGD